MVRGFRITLIFIFFSNCLFSQVDDTRTQILNYDNSKPIIISKGRQLMIEKLLEGDLNKVKEIADYLKQIEDKSYFAFYPLEYWHILNWTKDYALLAKSIENFDTLSMLDYDKRIPPPEDILYVTLKEKSAENEAQLKEQIMDADLDKETEQLLILHLDWLLLETRKNQYARDDMNNQADYFLQNSVSGRYDEFTKRFIKYKMVPKNWGITFEFFSGYGIFTGNLSENYTHNIPIGVAFDICYKDFELYLRDYIGINKTKRDFNYSKGVWEEGSRTNVFLPEATLGYVVYDDNRIKLSPFAGIASTDIGPTTKATETTPELSEVTLEFTTTYVVGMNFDIKFGPKHTPDYLPKSSYGFMRIRYGYSMPQFENSYEGMSGNMHYITIGFGGMARGLRRE